MKIDVKKEKKKVTLTLSGELTIHHAERLKKAFLDAFNDAPVVKVVIGEAVEVDLSFVQTLLSAARTARKKKIEFGFSKDSLPEPVGELCSRAGLDPGFGSQAL